MVREIFDPALVRNSGASVGNDDAIPAPPSVTAEVKAKRDRLHEPWPLYPSLLAAVFILNLWVEADISPYAMFRSLVVGMTVPLVVALVSGAILRDRNYGAAIAGLMVVVLVGWNSQLLLIALIALLGLVLFLLRRIRRAPIPWPRVTSALNTFAGALLVALAVKAAMHGTFGQAFADLHQGSAEIPPATAVADPTPDIYIIMPEDYPRQDTLKRVFGADPAPLLDGLRQRGFDVSAKSRTNYSVTPLTLLSMFEMRLIDDIDAMRPVLDGTREAQPLMRDLTNDSTAIRFLRQHGYRFLATASGFEEVAFRQADLYLDGGQMNEFETILVRITGLADIVNVLAPDAIGDSFRSRFETTDDRTAMAVEAAKAGPLLAFIHLARPHAPILYDANGGRVRVDARHPFEFWFGPDTSDADIEAAYRAELPTIDGAILRTVDTIRAGSPQPPVIIVMSDEGSDADLDHDPRLAIAQTVSSLFAANTPGHPGLFGDAPTPVNLFPILFDTYFGTNLPRSDDSSFVSAPATLFDFISIEGPDARPSPSPSGQ